MWAEALEPADSDPQSERPHLGILADYTSGPFRSSAALTEQRVGTGRALYLGWYPSGPQAEALLAHLAAQAGVHSLADVPDGMIASRHGPHLVLLNFTEEPLTATVAGRAVTVGPRDVQVVKANGT
jgi:beta-galactosidase GanA